MNPAAFEFAIYVPVTAPVAGVERMKPGRWPAGSAARTAYRFSKAAHPDHPATP